MKIQVRGKILEFTLPEQARETRDKSTPYWEEFCTKTGEPGTDFYKRFYLQCKIADALKGKYRSYCEPMAGLGIIASMFEKSTIELNDLDPHCHRALCHNFDCPAALITREDFNRYEPWDNIDLTFIDFNNFTVQRFLKDEFSLKTNLLRMMSYTDQYIVINDSTPFYLRYGKRSYANVEKLLDVDEDREFSQISHYAYALQKTVETIAPGWFLRRCYYFGSMAYHVFAKESHTFFPYIEMIEVPSDYKSQLEFKIL